jgi:hypothetical protein
LAIAAGFPIDHAELFARRSTLAKAIGLGRHAAAEPGPPATGGARFGGTAVRLAASALGPVNELDGMRRRQNSPGQISVGARVRIGFAGHLTGPSATCPRTPVHVSTLPQPSAAARLVRSGQAPSDLN